MRLRRNPYTDREQACSWFFLCSRILITNSGGSCSVLLDLLGGRDPR